MFTVYGRTSSSNTQKVLWALRLCGIEYRLVNASARVGEGSQLLVEHTGGKPFGVVGTEEYAKLNPHHRIPTVVDPTAEIVLWESHSCVRYIVEQYGGPALGEPASPATRARRSMWMDWVLAGSDFAPSFANANHMLIDSVARSPTPAGPLTADLQIAVDTYLSLFKQADTVFQDDRSFLAGDQFLTVADIPLAVELNRFNQCAAVLVHAGGALDIPPMPRLRRWYARILEDPTFQESVVLHELCHHEICSSSALGRQICSGLVS